MICMDGQKIKNMTWNVLKFCILRLGKNDEIKMNTCLLTSEFEEVIEAKEVVKDSRDTRNTANLTSGQCNHQSVLFSNPAGGKVGLSNHKESKQ